MTAFSYFAKNVPQYIHREKNTALIGLKGTYLPDGAKRYLPDPVSTRD